MFDLELLVNCVLYLVIDISISVIPMSVPACQQSYYLHKAGRHPYSVPYKS